MYDETTAVLDKVTDASLFKRFYDDDETGLNWILDNRARALEALGSGRRRSRRCAQRPPGESTVGRTSAM